MNPMNYRLQVTSDEPPITHYSLPMTVSRLMTDGSRPLTVLVTGAKGQLGSDIVNVLESDSHTIPVDIEDFDITDLEATVDFIKKARPNAIIHPAAFTNVDACET